MNNETKRYKVVIHDKEYNIVSDELEEHIMKAAELVDSTIHTFTSASREIDQQKIAILSALQLASRLLQVEQQLVLRREQEDALVEWTENKLSTL